MIARAQEPAKPAVAYLRRSTDKQEQSLDDQRRAISEWAERNGFVIVREYVDDAISGTSAKTRPAFQSMVADSGKKQFSAILFWASDRFSRGTLSETEHFRHVLSENGVTLHSITEDFIARDGLDGDVLRAVKQHMNRQYSVSLSQNTLRGQISSVLKASDPGRPAPYGYDREILGPDGGLIHRVRFLEGGTRETFGADGKLQARYAKGQSLSKPGKECTARLVLSDEARVQTVRAIFAMCVEGRGLKAIANELNRRGVMSPRGKLWQHTTLKALIANPVYAGDVAWNKRSQAKFYQARKRRADTMRSHANSGRVEMMDSSDWIVMPGTVPAIIDRETWEQAQAASAVRSKKSGGHGKQTDRWLLSGVLRCGHCGSSYWGLRKTKGQNHGLKRITTPYYVCAGRCRSGKSVCPFPAHVRADDLEEWVLGELQAIVLADSAGVDDAVQRFVALAKGTHPRAGEVDKHRAEIDALDEQVGALVAGLDPANLALLNTQLTQMRTRKEFLQQQIRALEASATHGDEATLRAFARERITLLDEAIKGKRDEKARAMLASFVDEIVIEPATKTGFMVLNAAALGLVPELTQGEPGTVVTVGTDGEQNALAAVGVFRPHANVLRICADYQCLDVDEILLAFQANE